MKGLTILEISAILDSLYYRGVISAEANIDILSEMILGFQNKYSEDPRNSISKEIARSLEESINAINKNAIKEAKASIEAN